jgi:hypothetical protein
MEVAVAYFKSVFHHLCKGTDENYETLSAHHATWTLVCRGRIVKLLPTVRTYHDV